MFKLGSSEATAEKNETEHEGDLNLIQIRNRFTIFGENSDVT